MSDFYAERPAFVTPTATSVNRCPACGELGHTSCVSDAHALLAELSRRLGVSLTKDHADVTRLLPAVRQALRDQITAEIEQFADDHSDVSDAYRHAAQLVQGVLCDCPGVFHPVEHGA